MRRTIVTLLGVLLLSAAPSMAGLGEKGDKEFGPYAGFGWLDDYAPAEPDDGALYGVRFGYFFNANESFEVSLQRLSTDIDLGPDFEVDSLRFNYLWNFRAGSSFRPFVTLGAGAERTDIDGVLQTTDLGINGGGGLRWYLTEHFGLRAEGRYVFTDVRDEIDEVQYNLEGTVGLLWSIGGGPPPDEDNDGVRDRRDRCPGTPAGAVVDETGCPSDADGDGVFNGIDRCADTPAGWPVDESGCPLDSDGDGVADGADSCPDTPAGATVDEKGCPSDADGDGVYDGLDRCADTPSGATVDPQGCPVDSDHDGVPDGIDQCPDTKRSVDVDEKGCEVVVKAPPLFEMEKKTLVLEGVNFEVDKAEITPDSLVVLEQVAASLRDWPEVRVEIGGHTDSSGSASHNMDLSQRRADSVKAFLVAKGIDPSRLATKGYGETTPIDTNDTPEGKARNRRVELTRLDQPAP